MSNLIFIRFRRGDINDTRNFYICQGLFKFFYNLCLLLFPIYL